MSAYWPSLIGGMLLGLSAVVLLLLDGRIAGISGCGAPQNTLKIPIPASAATAMSSSCGRSARRLTAKACSVSACTCRITCSAASG